LKSATAWELTHFYREDPECMMKKHIGFRPARKYIPGAGALCCILVYRFTVGRKGYRQGSFITGKISCRLLLCFRSFLMVVPIFEVLMYQPVCILPVAGREVNAIKVLL
jgi:hypothetical protein